MVAQQLLWWTGGGRSSPPASCTHGRLRKQRDRKGSISTRRDGLWRAAERLKKLRLSSSYSHTHTPTHAHVCDVSNLTGAMFPWELQLCKHRVAQLKMTKFRKIISLKRVGFFFRCNDMKLYRRCFLLKIRFAGHNVQGHAVSSLQMKFQHYAWTEEEVEYFSTSHQREPRTNVKFCWTKYYKSYFRQTQVFTARALHTTERKHRHLAIGLQML